MIVTLLITILIEGGFVVLYSILRKKPLGPILLTSTIGNVITQSMLWIILILFFRHYLVALLVAETVIWMAESLLLSIIPANRLQFTEALFISLSMNLASFSIGLLLPG